MSDQEILEIMDPPTTAKLLGVSEKTLTHWRYNRKGPPVYKVGRRLKYKRSEVMAWFDQQLSVA